MFNLKKKFCLHFPSELTEDKPKVKCWTPLFGYPQAVTHVFVEKAERLENQDRTAG